MSKLRRLVAPVGRPVRRAAAAVRTRGWPPHSRLFVEPEPTGWVLSYEARQLERTANQLRIRLGSTRWTHGVSEQSIFHLSHFTLLLQDFQKRGNHLGVAYFHGRPGTPGVPEFDVCLDTMRRRHADVDRVQVTNADMEAVVLETGIDPEKVHRIPIGIDVDVFHPRTAEERVGARESLGLPRTAFVVGSFQKDGVGWDEGLEPKLVKGPDVLLEVVERLRDLVPELFVLLTGPARGYVKAGLTRIGIPYHHAQFDEVEALPQAYDAVNVCLVTGRDEGGPRAVLEAMATGVPLVTTRAGQAIDLVRHGENGWMVDVDDVDGLVEWTAHVATASEGALHDVLREGRRTAEANSYDALRPRWRRLLRDFVAIPDA